MNHPSNAIVLADRQSVVLAGLPSHVPPLLKGGVFFIDNSTYTSIMECERAGLYRIIHQRQQIGKADALNFGGAVHEGLKVRYATGGTAHESLEAQISAASQYLLEHPTSVGDWRQLPVLREVLFGYARAYPVEEFNIFHVDGKPMVELAFAVPLGTIQLPEEILVPSVEDPDDRQLNDVERAQLTGGRIILRSVREIPVVWTGKIDMVVDRGGEMWLCDHKTTSVFGDSYFEGFHLSSQFNGYTYALEKCVGQAPRGVLLNALAIRKPTATGKGTTFHRLWKPIAKREVDEWHYNTLLNLTNFFVGLTDGQFPMRTTSCRTKWQRNCEYLGVCNMDQASRLLYLHSGDYETVTWSPLNANE